MNESLIATSQLTSVFILLGSLIIMFLGFLAPLIGFLFSLYQEGIKKISADYETDRVTQEQIISEKLKEKNNTTPENLKELEKVIKQVKKMNKDSKTRSSYLEKKTIYVKLFMPLMICFVLVLSSFCWDNCYFKVCLLAALTLIIIFVILELVKFIDVLHTIKGSVDEQIKKNNERTIGLLEKINEKQSDLNEYLKNFADHSKSLTEKLGTLSTSENTYLKNIKIRFGGVELKPNAKTNANLTLNKKASYAIAIVNSEPRMAKDVEIGFIFSSDLVVDNNGPDTMYKDPKDGEQIARYSATRIHGNTTLLKESISMTPIKKGTFSVKTFIKAENVETINSYLIFAVT